MRKRNSWIQKKSVVVIIAVLLSIAILAVVAELGMKSGSRPLGMIEKIKNGNKDNNESNSDSDLDSDNMEGEDGERESKNDSDSELNTGYGYEMDVFSDKNNSTEKKTVYEKGYDLPVDEQENKMAKEELHEMMQAVWPIYDKSEKGDTSNVVLPNQTVKKILDKIESCSVPAFFSGREEHMCNADKFDAFLKKAQKGEKDSIVVYEVHEDGGIGRNKYIFDGQNMYVLYVGSVWNDDEDVISIDTTYTRIKEWNYAKDGWFTGEYCVPEPPERSETADGIWYYFFFLCFGSKRNEFNSLWGDKGG